jgi:hypothetical protein
MSQEQARIQENIYPDDPDAQLLLQIPETVTLSGTLTLTQYTYPTNSFIVDHPVYGNVDSSVLLIDGDYATTGDVVATWPWTWPLDWGTPGGYVTSTLLTTTL